MFKAAAAPSLIRLNGRLNWQFADGTRLPVLSGAATAVDTEVPADLTGLEDDAVTGLLAEQEAEFDRLNDEGSRDLAVLTSIADDIDRLRAEQTRRETEAADTDAKIAALADRVKGADASDTGTEGGDEGDEGDEGADGGDTADAADKEPVTAAARPTLGDVARRAPKPTRKARPTVAITAAADLPGISPGATIDLNQLAMSMHDRARVLEDGQKAPVARIQIPHTHTLGLDAAENSRLLDDLVGHPEAEALVASGGWCAPSEPLWELFDLSPDTSNLFDLPSVGSSVRAGVLVPSFYDYTATAGALWTWTEANDIAALNNFAVSNKALTTNVATLTIGTHSIQVGNTIVVSGVDATFDGTYVVTAIAATTVSYAKTAANVASAPSAGLVSNQSNTVTKPCLRVPCPTWTEARLEAEGLCVTHGNLSDRAWPELTRSFLNTVMGAHFRRLSAAKIAKVIAGATVVTPNASMTPSDAYGDLFNVIRLAAADLRSQYRLGEGRSVDVVLPTWVVGPLRSTLAMRNGVDHLRVTDAQIKAAFSAEGIRVQFTPDWQALYNAAPATAWPTSVTFVMFLTGAYVSIDGGSIDLGVQRDSILNRTNDFTLAWSEQFYQVVRRGPLARSYTVELDVTGVTGGMQTATLG